MGLSINVKDGVNVSQTMVKVEIKATENGPSLVMVDGKTVTALCRCGSSNNKPYCDGTHSKIGFKAKATEVKVIE